MKKFSVGLFLIAAISGSFAACSSSDDSSSSSGGSAGNGGTSGEAGAPNTGGTSTNSAGSANEGGEAGAGTSGSAGESGTETGAAGSDSAGTSGSSAGGDAGNSSAGTSGNGGSAGDSSAGSAGTSGGASGSGGDSAGNGGSSAGGTSGSAGNAGTSGSSGSAGSGSVSCGAAAHTAFNSGIVAYFLANVASTGCFAAQTVGSDATAVDECASSQCGGDAGCNASFAWHDASYDSTSRQLTVQVDIASSIAASGNVSCTLLDQSGNSPLSLSLSVIDHGTSLSAQLDSLTSNGGDIAYSGCDGLTDEADVAFNDLQILIGQAQALAIDAVESYAVDCAP